MKKEEVKQEKEKEGIKIIEHDGKLYFSDEFENNNLEHPLHIPE